ncbi:MAG: tetratricopeptide repeat protein [Candidatus Latescibacteria bacterium]|nr:tetratricopeptide repeat protein [Candidatus Latescibacterota bacterium]
MVIKSAYDKCDPHPPPYPLPPPALGEGGGIRALPLELGEGWGLSRFTLHASRFTLLLFALLLFPASARALDDQAIADRIAARDFRTALPRLDSLLASRDLPTPVRQRAVLQRALCHKALARPAEALTGFEASHDPFPEIEDYLLLYEGECLEALNQPDQASSRYAALMKRVPDSLFRDDVRLRTARIADRVGKNEEAAKAYREVADTAPGEDDVAEALYGLASAQNALQKPFEAHETYRTLIHDHPGSRWALKALQPFGPPKTADDRYDRGQVYFQNGQWEEAIAAFRALIASRPPGARAGMAHYFSARAHFSAKAYAPATADFTTAYRRYSIPAALFYLGRCAVRADDDSKGADLLLEFAKKYPDHESADDALWYAAWSLERLKHYGKARQTYLRIASRYPKSRNIEQSRFRACLVLYSAGKFKEAARAFTDLGDISQGYQRDQSYFWVGKCHERLGDPASARSWYSRAAKSFPASYYASRAALALSPGERDTLQRQVLQSGESTLASADDAVPASLRLRKGDLLILVGLYGEAGRELYPVEKANDSKLSALRGLLRRYERIRSFGRAMRVGGRIVELEQRAGGRLSLDTIRRLYPTYYADLIQKPAAENRVEPPLVLAIIRQESAFDPTAVSSVGARGLMQIMPATGSAWAADMGIPDFKLQDLDDPAISIRYGCREIAAYLTRFPRDLRGTVLSLSAYNGSLNAAQKWDKTLSTDVDEFIENIPYHETRNYVKQVIRNYEIYKLLLSKQG